MTMKYVRRCCMIAIMHSTWSILSLVPSKWQNITVPSRGASIVRVGNCWSCWRDISSFPRWYLTSRQREYEEENCCIRGYTPRFSEECPWTRIPIVCVEKTLMRFIFDWVEIIGIATHNWSAENDIVKGREVGKNEISCCTVFTKNHEDVIKLEDS